MDERAEGSVEIDYRQLYQQSEEKLEAMHHDMKELRKRLSDVESEAFRYKTAFKLLIQEIKS